MAFYISRPTRFVFFSLSRAIESADFVALHYIQWALIVWLSTATVANLMVTVSLIWSFWANKTSFAEDDSWATKVLMYGVHTGLFTTIATIVDLCFVVAWPDTLAFAGLNYSEFPPKAQMSLIDLTHFF
jgi:hypothetical protein